MTSVMMKFALPPQSPRGSVSPSLRSTGPGPMTLVERLHAGQGLTLVHFSAQPERFLSLKPGKNPGYRAKSA